ncbi:YcjF family protein [Aetokthonos hydrillicola]|uniref:YcjF family protein n=1 Tax=Aetokthonos hydrillicola TaxID=1550245 RepID=UPI001ABABC81
MSLPRIIALIVGIVLIFGLSVWLIDSLSRLYWQWSYYSPFLGNLLLLLVVLVIGAIIAGFIYYILVIQAGEARSRRRRRQRAQVRVSTAKPEAASSTLQAVRQQVEQIQDEVTRQAILRKSQEIEENLQAGEIKIVVFGTGSAGKTSLVNAIMGRMVGRVDAPMGTTQAGETYTLRLKGLERKILITDTPGILEAGVAGTYREQLAREIAADANLLLFVVDNDIRKSEYEVLQILAEIGKRSLLVLNKTDLYTEEDKQRILAQLRQRVQGFITENDVIAIAANPQQVELEDGEIFQPEREIIPLLKRMAAVLRAEGEDLVADNILLQSVQLGEEARKLIDTQRRHEADKVVERFQWIGAGVVSVTPLPVVDLLATAAVNAQMVIEIGKIYGCDLNMSRAGELAGSLAKTIASLGIVKGALQILSTALQLNIGTLIIGRAIQGVTAAYLTRIAGKSFIEYFRHDQDWGDGGMTEVVQQQFQLNRRDEFIKAFIQQAIARVVKPLTEEGALSREQGSRGAGEQGSRKDYN